MTVSKNRQAEKIRVLKGQNTKLNKQIQELRDREDFSKAIDITKLEDLELLTIKANKSKKEEVIIITTLSDIHADEEVLKTVVSGLNEYNPSIAQFRLELYFKRVLYMLNQTKKAGQKFDTVILGLLGDLISGYIHEELEETNNMTPAEATIFVQEILARGIMTIASHPLVTKLIIPCVTGNHGRTTKKKRFNSGYKNSYEYIMYHNLQNLFNAISGYENVEFLIAESHYLYLDIFGKINLFSHGDHFRYAGGIGGIEVPLKKFILRENSLYPGGIDMAWMGHWHQYIVQNKVRINGSVIGYNAFARSYGFEPEPPRMQFQLLDKKRGYTLNNPIYLNDF